MVGQTAVGVISGANLGVSADTGVLLDEAVNEITDAFAAKVGSSGNIKFQDNSTALTIGIVADDGDAFPNTVIGLAGLADITLANTGDLFIDEVIITTS